MLLTRILSMPGTAIKRNRKPKLHKKAVQLVDFPFILPPSMIVSCSYRPEDLPS